MDKVQLTQPLNTESFEPGNNLQIQGLPKVLPLSNRQFLQLSTLEKAHYMVLVGVETMFQTILPLAHLLESREPIIEEKES